MKLNSYFIAGSFLCRTTFSLHKEGPFKETVEGYCFFSATWERDIDISSETKMSIANSPKCELLTEEEAVAIILRGSL